MGQMAIRVAGLGKKYRIGTARASYTTLRDELRKWTSPRELFKQSRQSLDRTAFWALREVSFEVRRGEVVGIIGRNGAGKSTLLKILSRITKPTEGEADIYGRIGSLLEVGTGFHPELTGRENVYLNGAVLGMGRAEITRKFDEIVTFAEVEKFLDTPVKFYSSGMYMRLAFAVAAHLEPEILVVDEVLAVGDAEFQKRCLGKMGDVAKGGRTVLFVSHNLHAVTMLCSRVILLQQGMIEFEGTAASGVRRYLDTARNVVPHSKPQARAGSGEWRFMAATAANPVFRSEEPKEFTFEIIPTGPHAAIAYLSGLLFDGQGTVLSQFDSRLTGVAISGSVPIRGLLRFSALWLKPGAYTLDLYICSAAGIIDHLERASTFEVSPMLPYACSASADALASALILSDFEWRLNQ